MAEMLAQVEKFCEQNKLLATGDSVLIACSGGPDSLALIQVLLALREKYRLHLAVGHFEHGIRGAASLEDAAFVRVFCQRQGLAFYLAAADVPAYSRQHHLSLETAARMLRYRFLRATARKLGAGTLIATAHQADDQAETVLMRILRGTGVDGLAGIQPRTADIIRPLLCVPRAEIEAYCQQQGLQPRYDATNAVPDCTRNRLRLMLLPQLGREYNPDIAASLCRLAAIAAEESDFLAGEAQAAWDEMAVPLENGIQLPLAAFRRLHPALQLAVLRRALSGEQGTDGLGYVHYHALRQLLQNGRTGAGLRLPHGIEVRITYGAAVFLTAADDSSGAASSAEQSFVSCLLTVPGVTDLPESGWQVTAELLTEASPVAGADCILCDADQLPGPLQIRSRQPGDKLVIESGTQKVKKLLIDHKVPRWERNQVPVFTAGNMIFWVGGIRQAAVARITDTTRHFLRLTLVRKCVLAPDRENL